MTEPKIDFAIITAIEIERRAICQAFGMSERHRVFRESHTYWCKRLKLKNGEFYEIVIVQSPDMGNVDAALLASETIHHWHPAAILLVGIAAGVDIQKQHLGDVVIASNVYYYERGKVTTEGNNLEPYMVKADATLWDRIRAISEWKSPIVMAKPDDSKVRPQIHYGVIASGENVIADAVARDQIIAGHRKIQAVEMESYGFSAAVWQSFNHIRHLVIKSICDWADNSKNDQWHQYAAVVAADFTKHFLLNRPLEPLNLPAPKTAAKKKQIDSIYQPIIEAFTLGSIVPFLGAGVNLYNRLPFPTVQSDQYPLSEIELASLLSKKIKRDQESGKGNDARNLLEDLMGIPCLFCHLDLIERPGECPIRDKIAKEGNNHNNEVLNCPIGIQQRLDVAKMNLRFLSQHFKSNNSSSALYRNVQALFKHSKPNQLHYFFAKLPRRIASYSDHLPYALIVTTNYDNLLEEAFREANQPFDVVFYVAEGDERGSFKHKRYGQQEAELIWDANQYPDLPIGKYPIILKLYGSLEASDFVITEDHYFDYLLNSDLANRIPTSLLKLLKQSSILFLGYSLNDYDLRLILHQSWAECLFVGRNSSWFVHQSQPGSLDENLWRHRNVTLIPHTLEQCLTELEKGIKKETITYV